MSVLGVVAVLSWGSTWSADADADGEMLQLIGKDAPMPTIVHSDENDPAGNPLVSYAAQDLQRYLGRVTGQKPKIGAEAPGTVCIHVGRTRYVNSLRLGLDNLAWDGFIICTRRRGDVPQLVISGRTPQGTYYGVNYFLREYVGVNWLFPGKLGEIVPRKETVSIPAVLEDKQEPDFLPPRTLFDWPHEPGVGIFGLRHMMSYSGIEPDETNPHPAFKPSLGYAATRASHNIAFFLPQSLFDEHPEYFSMIDGERRKPLPYHVGWQPCMSNPAVVQLAIDATRKYFDENPEKIGISLGENDSGGYCECNACRAMDTDRRRWATDLCRNYANRKWKFYVQVGEALQESHPGKEIGVFAYLWSALPPDDPEILARLEKLDNIVVQKTFFHESDMRKFDEWSRLGLGFAVWDYIYSHWNLDFRHYPRQWARKARQLHNRGARSYFAELCGGEQWAPKFSPKRWVIQRLLWDLQADEDVLMDDYCRLAYGAGAEPMRAFWDRWEDIWMRRDEEKRYVFGAYTIVPHPVDLGLGDMTLADLDYLGQRIQDARAAADTDDDQARVERVATIYDHAEPAITMLLKTREFEAKIGPAGNADVLLSDMAALEAAFRQRAGVLLEPHSLAPGVPGYIPGDVERSLDDAAGRITALLAKTGNQEKIIGWWQDRANENAGLKPYAGSQIYLLRNPERKNLLRNPSFRMAQGEVNDWSLSGPPPVVAAGPAGEDNAVRFGGFVAEEKQFLDTASFYQDVSVEPGARYRAMLKIRNLVDNRNRRAWSDQALFTLNITWLADKEPIRGQHAHSVRVWEAVPEWEEIQVTATAPGEANGARFQISMLQYLDKRDYLDLEHEEHVLLAEPRFERISR